MKKLIMTLAAFSLLASGPAFAGCGSHGGGYSRQYSTPAPRVAAERKAAAKMAKAMAAARAAKAAEDAAAAIEDAAEDNMPKQAVAAVEAIAGAGAAMSIAAEITRECKQYSATIGALINIACE
jgi:hypothetical protein